MSIVAHEATPTKVRTNEILMKNLASFSFCSEKLFPRKRCTPIGIPRDAAVAKMVPRETTVEEIPTISGVVILDMMSQKMYPKAKVPKVSM